MCHNLAMKRWLLFALACLVLVPVCVYGIGSLLLGPYEGDNGLPGFMGSLYGDALTGGLAAWLLLTSPLLLVAIWVLVIRLRRVMPG